MSWSPPEDTPELLWLERSYLDGSFLGTVSYGMHCCVFAATIYLLLNKAPMQGPRIPMLIFACAVFISGTVGMAAGVKWAEMIWIDDRAYPGGPAVYLQAEFYNPMNIISFASYIFNNALVDVLLLYRCWIIWDCNNYVIAIPLLAVMASISLSIIACVQTAMPWNSMWANSAYQFAVPYWSLSISVNLILTLAIVVRLLMARKQLKRAMGDDYALEYTSLIAIIVESASLYSITSLIYIIAFAIDSNVQNLILPLQSGFMCISPELILIRVAFGQAFTKETAKTVSDVRFRAATRTHTNVYTVADSVIMNNVSSGVTGHDTLHGCNSDAQDNGSTSRVGSAMEIKVDEVV